MGYQVGSGEIVSSGDQHHPACRYLPGRYHHSRIKHDDELRYLNAWFSSFRNTIPCSRRSVATQLFRKLVPEHWVLLVKVSSTVFDDWYLARFPHAAIDGNLRRQGTIICSWKKGPLKIQYIE